MVRSCMIDFGDDANFSTNSVANQILRALDTLHSSGSHMWTFLETTLVAEVVDAQGAGRGLVYGTPDPAFGCQDVQ